MEKTDRETHDFMNVESFSQLPFIRPSPLKEKGIRLFGQEFGAGGSDSDDYDTSASPAVESSKETTTTNSSVDHQNSRKFECHYCCRNFPTSQALGGHQNAHKRERQHAKRAHLQSTMVNGTTTFSDAQMYGLINYHRFPPPFYHTNPNSTTINNTSYMMNHHTTTRFNYNYGSMMNNNNNYNSSSSTHQTTPINGSPLAVWRYPNAHQNSTSSMFNRDHHSMVSTNEGRLQTGSRIVPMTSASYIYDSKLGVQDQVSLDLHL